MRVLLVDDHQLFRAGLESLCVAWGHTVVGSAGDGMEAHLQARRLRPDLVLMDINLPKLSGLEATRVIKAEMPEIKIIIVTVSDEQADLFEAVKSGAEGYLLKNMSEDEFRRALDAVANGEPALSPGLAMHLLHEFGRISRGEAEVAGPAMPQLTEREIEVLRLAAGGSSNRDIAAALTISEHTVAFHMKNILSKLHTSNRTEAVAYALRTGLVGHSSGR